MGSEEKLPRDKGFGSDLVEVGEAVKKTPPQTDKEKMLALLGDRALRAGSKGKMGKQVSDQTTTSGSTVGFSKGGSGTLAHWQSAAGGGALANLTTKYLVLSDGIVGPFMALCLRMNGLDCDLAQSKSTSDADMGTIVMTPSVTQVMGDALNVNVPSGSVIGRLLTFDHVGNDMADLDLNEFREQGESPTFFACDRQKIEASLMSLCKVGNHACNVLGKVTLDRNGLQEGPGGEGVRATFSNGVSHDYAGIICTTRNTKLVPELLLDEVDLRSHGDNQAVYRKAAGSGHRWIEMCLPPLPELTDNFERRFTPGSQEVVEIVTANNNKMCVRPTMMATKLFYNLALTIPESAPDPRLKSTSMKRFWDEVIEGWTGGSPGYVQHTMFRPMMSHIQQHWNKSTGLCFRTPSYNITKWTEGKGKVMKIGHSAHGTVFDGVDISDAQAFTDCMVLARGLASGEDPTSILERRRLAVEQELDHHEKIKEYSLAERSSMSYNLARMKMKMMGDYKKQWRAILGNYVTMLPKTIPK